MYFNIRKWYRASTKKDAFNWVKGLHGVKVTEDEGGLSIPIGSGKFIINEAWVSKRPPKPILITDTKYWKWTLDV